MAATSRPAVPCKHTLLRLAADLLLVFKPRGHREAPHRHAHRQRLRVLRGRLVVHTARRTVLLGAGDVLTLAAGRVHSTHARADTWLVAETVPTASRLEGVPKTR